MPPLRSLALPVATLACVLALLAPDVLAQRRRAAPQPPAPPPVAPACVDFYRFTNQEWLAAHPPQRGMDTLSALGELPQHAAVQQQALLDGLVTDPDRHDSRAQRLLAWLWASGLDEAAIEADGTAPLAPLLARINAITRARDIAPVLAALHQAGIAAGFTLGVETGDSEPPHWRVQFSEGRLGLPDPAYYLRDDEDTRALRERYLGYLQRLLVLTGSAEEAAQDEAAQILALETRLAAVSRPLAAMATPDAAVTVKTADLNRRYRSLRLRELLRSLDSNPADVTLANPAALAELDHLAASLSPGIWKPWLRVQLAHALAPYLSAAFREAEFELYGRILRGQSAPPPRPQQVLDAINRFAGSLLSREYSDQYLPADTRANATAIAAAIRAALHRAVERSTWLGADSKAGALAKLDALRIDIAPTVADGLPDSPLPTAQSASFAGNILAVSAWRVRERLRLVGTTHPDPDTEPPAQQPLLAYERARNRLRVSAAALQPPVWRDDDTLAAHYGSYGALVAHQLSRAVDARGQETAADGSPRTGWGEAEHAAWDTRIARLATQYSAYPVPNARGVYLNGARTADENAADLAAVEIAFAALADALPAADAAARQDFFRRWAELWREQTAPELAAWNAATEPHAPGQWRANGPLANHPGFADTFACTPGTGMLRPVQERIAIWP